MAHGRSLTLLLGTGVACAALLSPPQSASLPATTAHVTAAPLVPGAGAAAPVPVGAVSASVVSAQLDGPGASIELGDLSAGMLGVYRKVMEIEDEIRVQAERYGVGFDLARAVCMYESGGNPNLTSGAGAQGFFQVMPRTQRALRVDSNIEAGIKYLSQMIERFEREDYALAAYNGGPARVGRGRAMPLESLQYVLGVGHYRTMLKLHEPSIRRHASELSLEHVGEDDDWWTVADRLGLSLVQLRLHNPYLSQRKLREGRLIAYPRTPRGGMFTVVGDHLEYRTRLGDNYFTLAFIFEVELDELRAENQLWHLQTLPPDMLLRLPMRWEDDHELHRVADGETLAALAEQFDSTPWRLIRDNGLWAEQLSAGMVLRVRPDPAQPRYVTHRVRRGETLIGLASRYGTTVRVIQDANNMGTRTLIRVGQRLLVPARAR